MVGREVVRGWVAELRGSEYGERRRRCTRAFERRDAARQAVELVTQVASAGWVMSDVVLKET